MGLDTLNCDPIRFQPLMLASMNGHVAAVKLLLDMGSDINAQIETNRNTALTLACFQGRAEIVSLLVDRKANIEHRAKTGLTPLMESGKIHDALYRHGSFIRLRSSFRRLRGCWPRPLGTRRGCECNASTHVQRYRSVTRKN